MIVCQLMGGLGNQMFQYAFGLSLSKKYNQDLVVDLSYLQKRNLGPLFVYRDYDLDVFELSPNFNTPIIDIEISERKFEYDEELISDIENNLDKNILFKGQYQSYKYFDEYFIRKSFQFSDKVESSNPYTLSLLENIKSSNSVMINVRRSDYLNTDFHGVYGMDYINSAVKIIESKIENPKYFIFSDDIDWCVENIDLPNMTIVNHFYKGPKFSHYLQLMMNCKHFIIPNSSFAWWSAWLSKSPDKIVIAPKRWFNRDDINTNDLIPESWIRI